MRSIVVDGFVLPHAEDDAYPSERDGTNSGVVTGTAVSMLSVARMSPWAVRQRALRELVKRLMNELLEAMTRVNRQALSR